MGTTLDRPLKSKQQLSPARQQLATAIQNLKTLEDQFAALDAATNWNGVAEVRMRAAEDAALEAQQQLQQALKADADHTAGGPAPIMLPRHAREALLRAQDEVTDAKATKERTEQRYLEVKQEVEYAKGIRDRAHEVVLREQAGQVPALAIEVARLQSELAAKGQLLDALAGFPGGLFYANVDRDVTGNWLIPPPSWEIARRPLAPLALYRDASERLKHDATVILPDLSRLVTEEHPTPIPKPEPKQVAAPKPPQFQPTLTPGFVPERLPTPQSRPEQSRGNQHPSAMPINGDLEGQRNPIRTGRVGGLTQRSVTDKVIRQPD